MRTNRTRHHDQQISPHNGPYERQADKLMNVQHVNVKIFVDGELTVDPEKFIEVFHGLVAEQAMPEMMIDVADYRHVPDGVSVLMAGLEADYALDKTGGRFGVHYNRKGAVDASNADQFQQALTAATSLCSVLEAKLDGLKFARDEFELMINDRGLAPNTDESREAIAPELTSFANGLIDGDANIEFHTDPRARLGATIKLSSPMEFAA